MTKLRVTSVSMDDKLSKRALRKARKDPEIQTTGEPKVSLSALLRVLLRRYTGDE